MDPEENTKSESKEAVVKDEDDMEDAAFENERCGICTYVVIDRGVLDCCHHWFCFECIDKWATITNHCPLCKNEFQLITCLPVYDTTGSIKAEEYSFSGDDDWCIQGKNNTLSFPSYYIDEDAVICLDGDGCKIRSGLSTTEDGLPLDTSIACDSCDIWYHAFCVGFNPECTSENSWLCPRCASVEVQQKWDCLPIQNPSKHFTLRSAGHVSNINTSFLGKVSVSVADAGETAVVVSMVGGEPRTEASFPLKNDLDITTGKENGTSLSDSDAGNTKLDMPLDKSGCVELICNSLMCSDDKGSIPPVQEIENSSEGLLDMSSKMDVIQPDVEPTENSLAYAASEMVVVQADDILNTSLDQSQGAMLSSPCVSVIHGGFQAKNTEEITHSSCNFNEYNVSCPLSSDNDENKNGLSENNTCDTIPHLDISVTSPSSVDDVVTSTNEDILHAIHPKDLNSRGLTMKHMEKFETDVRGIDHLSDIIGKQEGCSQVKVEAEHPAKRAKLNENSQIQSSESQDHTSVMENSQTCSVAAVFPDDDNLRCAPYEEALAPDIMDIVQEPKHRKYDGEAGINPVTKTIEKRDNSAGLRVKKIMRRAGNKESSILFQELGKEIKVVENETSNSTGQENAFDGELLTAFRNAMVKPKNELSNKLDPSVLGVRKSLLQKGKIRDNLTKKIYGTSTGRRRRAWDRDREIEFWKYRCSRMKPQKTQTVQSVLELFKRTSNSCLENLEMDQGPEGEATDSILSRVYLADASVFPRKDDIKPLSALAASSPIDNNQNVKNINNLPGKDSQTTYESAEAENPKGISKGLSPVKVPSFDNTGRRLNAPCITGEARPKTRSTPVSWLSGPIGREQNSNEPANQFCSSKNDKRKWALEVLARKNALANSSGSRDKQENGAVLQGNYPLLAQLPVDMRPVPASSRHNKVPVAVRQAQLYRITENYLRSTNLSVIRRTAETELAVADAVNVEKAIFERSNSKLVYTNLCSQVLSQRTKSQAETTASHLTGNNVCGLDHSAKETYAEPGATVSSKVEEALQMAGLSDTPPSSPDRVVKNPSEEDDPSLNANKECLENVLDVDSHPELDVYQDFEYDLGDKGHIAYSSMPNASRVSKLPPEDADSRMKVILSTLKFEESDKFSDSDSLKPLSSVKEESTNDNLIVEAQSDSFTLLEYQKANDAENAKVDVRLDTPLTLEPSRGHKEPSLAEYKELYKPEKERLVNVISDVVIGEGSNFMELEAAAKGTIPPETENDNSKDGVTVSEFDTESCMENKVLLDHKSSGGGNSPTHSSIGENAPKEGKSKSTSNKFSDSTFSISKKVEAYIKEHIRPLCKSGVITVDQYRWAVVKTTDKVMRYHYKDKNASFLIKEGEKVKKLAEQYVEVAQLKEV
ncbi:uncharacterized protein At4g10930 [Elaeis guineensis]|uniref:Uncharacterized protein At4g10930 n=1 Tax=Elaeis guineensis var. tenera TaxID=51953 RepID=A0A6I9R0P7_ELAGV|nr:uncharacterized protein At4g10930 [Elaeis guineensis]